MTHNRYWNHAEKRLLANLRMAGKGSFATVGEAIAAGACTELDWCEALDAARGPVRTVQIHADHKDAVVKALRSCPGNMATAPALLERLTISRAGFYSSVKALERSGKVRTIPGRCGRNPYPMTIKLVAS